MTDSKYDIPFNNQMNEKLKGILETTTFKSFKPGKRKDSLQSIKDQYFILPPLDKYKEDGVDHINILTDKTRLGSLLNIESVLEFDHEVYGTFKTIRGFLSYISSVERDDRLRRMEGKQLRELSKLMTKNKEIKNVRTEVISAVYQRILQYKDAIDVIKACNLPIDCYYVNSSGIKIRPVYSSWYIKGLQLIIESIKEDKPLDLSIFETSKQSKKRTGEKPLVNRLTKSSVVKYYFSNFLARFKGMLRTPQFRLTLSVNLDVDSYFNNLEEVIGKLEKLAETNEEVYELVEFVNNVLASNDRYSFNFKSFTEDEEGTHLRWIHQLISIHADMESAAPEIEEIINYISSGILGLSYIEDIYKLIEEKCTNIIATNYDVENYYQEILNDIRDGKTDIPTNVADSFSATYNISNNLLVHTAFTMDTNNIRVIKSRMEEIESLIGEERFRECGWIIEFIDYFTKNHSSQYIIEDLPKLIKEVTGLIKPEDVVEGGKNINTLISRYTETCLALYVFSRLTDLDFEWFEGEYADQVLVTMTDTGTEVNEILDRMRDKINNMIRDY